MFNDNDSLSSSPFGYTGQGSFGHPTEHSHDTFGRDVYSRTNSLGLTTHETRDHLGNVIDRRDSLFD